MITETEVEEGEGSPRPEHITWEREGLLREKKGGREARYALIRRRKGEKVRKSPIYSIQIMGINHPNAGAIRTKPSDQASSSACLK